MSLWLKVAAASIFFAIFFIAGCAIQPAARDLNQYASWRGRIALRIDSDQPQSVSAGFELVGNAQAGELTLLTPLGTTALSLIWSKQTAVMRSNGEVRYFNSLDSLIKQAIGTDIPVEALFAWLSGDSMDVSGWSADLSQYASGRITARRTEPSPLAELRLVLEK